MLDAYQAEDFSEKEKKYILAEFPYPSGLGLHIGHAFTFTGTDIFARYHRMCGYNVLFPMGWDAFGLPTENFAISSGRRPQDVTRENTDTFRRQMNNLGLSFDWERELDTTDPDYYRWTQWIFIQLYKKGLAYKKEMPINWCPSCKVGLANEEVLNGRCERCGAETSRRNISQWIVKITAYAERLLEGLEKTNFVEKVKTAQVNWIGRSEGANIYFPLKDSSLKLEVFTTRPDTLWGATFMVLAPEHPLMEDLLGDPQVSAYVSQARKKSDMERSELNRDKSGVFSGLFAINPATGREIPVWVSDFVLGSYGTGAIMSVPAHDQRDYDFAKKFGLPIIPVIQPQESWDFSQAAYEGQEGILINSDFINGLEPCEAIKRTTEWLQQEELGETAVSYHLRDWIFSRQHYWGEPIPMIHCEKCGWVPVPEEELPVVLPEVEHYQPTDTGESPLANISEWVNTNCPECGSPARRETDTMPNWAGSDWYFLRFTDVNNHKILADPQKLSYWMPVDIYVGGDEHNTLHLLYSRFIYQFLYDLGVVPQDIPEPYQRRLSHGVILGPDGSRMSKSRGNVIVPEDITAEFGVDVLRLYLMFIGPFDATLVWNERALMGVKRFLDKFVRYIEAQMNNPQGGKQADRLVNHLGLQVAEDIQQFKFNTAVAKLMETLNELSGLEESLSPESLLSLLKILAPFAPFTTEELWQKASKPGSVHETPWPEYNPDLEQVSQLEISVQVNGKLRGVLQAGPQESEESIRSKAAALESVARHLQKGQVRKVIYIEGRTINFVVS